MNAAAVADALGGELELDDEPWLARQVERASGWLDRGHGCFGLTIVAVDGAAPRAASLHAPGTGPPTEGALRTLVSSLDASVLRALIAGPVATSLRQLVRDLPGTRPAMLSLQEAGHRDALLVVAATKQGEAVVLGALNHVPLHLSKQSVARLQLTAVRLAAVFEARRAVDPIAAPGQRAETLREAAREEIAQTDAARPTEVSALWDEVARGHLRVVDHHDHEGRMYLVAMESAQGGRELDELQVEALSMLADGYTQKDIADALAISPATVSRRLAAALDAMGLRSTAEAVAIFGSAIQSED